MKRLLLAGLLVLPFALARAQQSDAYGSLIGMADSAASDKGPQAGVIPPGRPADDEEPRYPAVAPAVDWTETEIVPSAPSPAQRSLSPRRDRSKKRRNDDAPSVTVPSAGAPRVWTKVFSALLPPMVRISSYEVVVSSAVRRDKFDSPRPETSAVVVGGARGVLELVAVATAPTLAER